ncbi:hypothetical protein [Candidatus Pantoea bituminis]|uniref:hypothetical protein n=1 Tax=Candidatus Pantoea bituminis TaxID=2831036 RepID=UPI00208E0F31|nr:hypothetical protein [Pantoea bituminis]
MVNLLAFGSRYRQSRLLLPDDEGTFNHPAPAFVLRGNIPDRSNVSLFAGETMSITRSFLTELRTPFDMVLSVATRVASEHPYLRAALRRTSWLASPSGHYEFRYRVWFDDQCYHAIVMARMMINGQPGNEFIFSRHGKHFTHKAAAKIAQQAASDAAIFRMFTAQK